MDKNIVKERYEPPEIETEEVRVECGFAGSIDAEGTVQDIPHGSI